MYSATWQLRRNAPVAAKSCRAPYSRTDSPTSLAQRGTNMALPKLAFFFRAAITCAVPLFCHAFAHSQEPPASSESTAPSVVGPAAALRDLLSAACAHDEKALANFFTAAN